MDNLYRKNIRRYEQVRHLHELTFSCFDRQAYLVNDTRCRILADCLDAACEEQQFKLIAFVFMPEHVHLLVLPMTTTSEVSRLLARTKQPTTKKIRETLKCQGSFDVDLRLIVEKSGKLCLRFWQEGPGFDRDLFSPQAVAASIDYIHQNPVRRGICNRAIDFKWSSARFHLQGIIEDELPKLTRPDPEWFHVAGSQTEIV